MSSIKPTIAVVDYGMGNLHSVSKALEHVAPDTRIIVSADIDEIEHADRVVFPGVGAIRDCMAEIRRLQFDRLVRDVAASGRPLLGICVGMQSLMRHSEENQGVECLDLMPGEVKFFGNDLQENGERLKVPHMGWNQVKQDIDHPLWQGIKDEDRFYFVHSYYVTVDHPELVGGSCHYGVDFAAAVYRDNLFAVQFHPEKSQHAGLELLKNFAHWDGKL